VLEQVGGPNFRLLLPKRGKRAGAMHPDDQPTTTLWLRQSDKGIFWQHSAPPEQQPDTKENKGGQPSKQDRIIGMNMHTFIGACTDTGEGKNVIANRLEQWLSAQGEDVSSGTCKRLIERLASNPCNKLKKTADGMYVKGPNA
jgi:hypothetical protein